MAATGYREWLQEATEYGCYGLQRVVARGHRVWLLRATESGCKGPQREIACGHRERLHAEHQESSGPKVKKQGRSISMLWCDLARSVRVKEDPWSRQQS